MIFNLFVIEITPSLKIFAKTNIISSWFKKDKSEVFGISDQAIPYSCFYHPHTYAITYEPLMTWIPKKKLYNFGNSLSLTLSKTILFTPNFVKIKVFVNDWPKTSNAHHVQPSNWTGWKFSFLQKTFDQLYLRNAW